MISLPLVLLAVSLLLLLGMVSSVAALAVQTRRTLDEIQE
jgi:hypothetical protein